MKLQDKDARGRKRAASQSLSAKLSPVQSTVGPDHQESDPRATSQHARIDQQPSQSPRLRGIIHYVAGPKFALGAYESDGNPCGSSR